MAHLCLSQRYTIASLRQQGLGPTRIAEDIGVDKSTVSRELRRNTTAKGYQAEAAQKKAMHRCKRRPYKARAALWQEIVGRLEQQHSPEQISRRLKKEEQPSLSHEAIYQAIYADKQRGGDLHKHLRRARKKRRKRRDSPHRRGRIPFRVGIEERPPEVEARTEPGHWEADTVVGAEREGALLTLVERQSRLLKVAYLPKTTAQAVEAATVSLLKGHAAGVKTITFDNGKEFTNHYKIAQQLDCQTYFTHPYAPWERGTNENTNGLLRQYVPKKVPLLVLTPQRLQAIEDNLNHRPRKTLDFCSPLEFLQQKLKNAPVAFES